MSTSLKDQRDYGSQTTARLTKKLKMRIDRLTDGFSDSSLSTFVGHSDHPFGFLSSYEHGDLWKPDPPQSTRSQVIKALCMLDADKKRERYRKSQYRYFTSHDYFEVRKLRSKKLSYADRVYWRWLCRRLRNGCQMCGKEFPLLSLTLDHVIPVSKNGPHVWTNFQPLCQPCNSSKGVKKFLSPAVKEAQIEWLCLKKVHAKRKKNR